jgi:hypothetical protein
LTKGSSSRSDDALAKRLLRAAELRRELAERAALEKERSSAPIQEP